MVIIISNNTEKTHIYSDKTNRNDKKLKRQNRKIKKDEEKKNTDRNDGKSFTLMVKAIASNIQKK